MIVGGEVWVDAEPTAGLVRAFIRDELCAEGAAGSPPDGFYPTVTLTIPPDEERPGCGAPGSVIRFEIDGRPAKQTLTWAAGVGVGLRLSSGPEAAVYSGIVVIDGLPPPGFRIEPLIQGKVCGRQVSAFRGEGPRYPYEVLVYPDEVSTGCGRPGAVIEFRAILVDPETESTVVLADLEGVMGDWTPGERSTLPDAAADTSVGTAE
jgi:hypothetical protein